MTRTNRCASPHVVVVCVDALRADCLANDLRPASIWEETGPPETPAMSAFAASAWTAPVAVAASSWTKPSVPSIFLSRHPSEHGVLEVAKGDAKASTVLLPSGMPTMAELFRDAGYRTIGLAHNAQMDPSLGFGRGFDVFDADAGGGTRILAALESLDPLRGEKPAFLYLHLIEPHWPFGATVAERAERFATGRFAFHRWDARGWKAFKKQLRKGNVSPTEDETRFLRATYRLAVEEADERVGAILEWLDGSGAGDRSTVLLTADHGEELLDHGLVGHGQSLHEELVRVPFALRIGAAVRVPPLPEPTAARPVSHVDILPTLLECAGLPVAPGVSGKGLFADDGPREAFSEVKHKRRYHQAVRSGRWKLIRSFVFRRAEDGAAADYNNLGALFAERAYHTERRLYDVEVDPGERRNLLATFPETVARLELILDRWWGELRLREDDESRDLDAELIRRLEALGYL
ncbi:MAG: sulfatase family protein [Candidatus Eiseniibacteriota bacterium]